METAGRIRDELAGMGIPYEEGGGNRHYCHPERKEDQPVIGLRCDIDALPIREVRIFPTVPRTRGVMHACDMTHISACF